MHRALLHSAHGTSSSNVTQKRAIPGQNGVDRSTCSSTDARGQRRDPLGQGVGTHPQEQELHVSRLRAFASKTT